tara:strand:- start:2510 stop:3547 length:1038 start_codon:yes stop_codon:yes gene_type:complete
MDSPLFHGPGQLGIPWVDSPLFESQLATSSASDAQKDLARRFGRDGYLVLDGPIEPDLIDEILEDSKRFYDPRAEFDDLPPQVVTLLKQGLEQAHSCRVQDAWWVSDAVKRLAAHPRVMETLRFLYQREPIPFQTLSFPVGSEQEIHADTIHFDSLPSSFMCGVWVALQDIEADQGPVIYYPGSQKLPVVRLEHLNQWAEDRSVAAGHNYDRFVEYVQAIVDTGAFEAKRLIVPKGTVLIWSANLLHGGSRIDTPDAPRHSQVTHYFFDGCAYTAPVLSNLMVGEAFLRNVWDIGLQRHVPHVIGGRTLEPVGAYGRLQRLRLADSPAIQDVGAVPDVNAPGMGM